MLLEPGNLGMISLIWASHVCVCVCVFVCVFVCVNQCMCSCVSMFLLLDILAVGAWFR